MEAHLIELVDISKVYGDTEALQNINLYVKPHEFLTLLGPSGCGKTTILRLIGGFTEPTTGKIMFDGVNITALPPHKRMVNTVFQRYALFPHLNIYENIAFGLNIQKMPKEQIAHKVMDALRVVGLTGYERRDVDSLSGGQQQRVAIARAIVNEPKVLLLDEPLGALDLKMRKEMQVELKNMQRTLGITFIYVTHDQEEALAMSDTIIVMRDGCIQQTGAPENIYNEPQNAFVADFIGESNIVDAVMPKDRVVSFLGRDFECLDGGFERNAAVEVVVRPEDIQLGVPENGMIQGVVEAVTFMGVHYEMLICSDGFTWMVHATTMAPVGVAVGLTIVPDSIHVMKKSVAS